MRYSDWIESALTSLPFARRTLRLHVRSWLISRIALIGFSRVRSRKTVPGSSSMRSKMLVVPTFKNVAYSLMFESPTITWSLRNRSASACGSSRVLMIGPATRGRRRDAFPDVLRTLRQAEHRASRSLQNLARTCVDLPAHEERDQDLCVVGEIVSPAGQVVLVTTVRVSRRVGVVLEQVDDAADTLFAQPRLCPSHQRVEYPLPRLVVRDEVADRVALGSRVLGVAPDVQVEARTVLEEDVRGPPPADHPPEQVPGNLVGAQPPLAAQGARDPVLVLEPENAPIHPRSR